MEKALGLTIALMLLSAVATAAESPLAEVEWLTGGQWESTAELPGGHKIQSRMVAEFGPGKWSLRMRQFIMAAAGEYQQYETFLWVDPRSPRVQFVTLSTQGAVIRGDGEIKDGVMTLHQDATKMYPEMRSIFRLDPDDKNKYVGENWWNQKAGWKRVMNAVSERKELAPPKELDVPERRGKLDVLKHFAGGEFRYYAKGQDPPLGRHWNRFSLNGRVLFGESYIMKDGAEVAESSAAVWFDPAKKAIESVSVSASGAVTTGTARVEGDGIVWETTATARDAEPIASRSVITWTDADTYEMQMYVKDGADWKASVVTLVGRREKPTK